MGKRALVMFSAGKDSSMALNWAIKNGYSCTAFIATNKDKLLQHSDGPEISVLLAKFIAKYIFNVPTKFVLTNDVSYRDDISNEVEKQIIDSKPNLLITGDINHVDGMINFLRKKFENKYPKTAFISIGDLYTTKTGFDYDKYISDAQKNLTLIFSGVRLPDFKDFPDIVGKGFTPKIIKRINSLGIDPLGEDGEYQSLCLGIKKSLNSVSINNFTILTLKGRDIKDYKYNVMSIKKYNLEKQFTGQTT